LGFWFDVLLWDGTQLFFTWEGEVGWRIPGGVDGLRNVKGLRRLESDCFQKERECERKRKRERDKGERGREREREREKERERGRERERERERRRFLATQEIFF
jgi:hypothetical protein